MDKSTTRLDFKKHRKTLRGLGLVKKRPYRRRVWKRFRAEAPNERWRTDIAETLLDGRSLYKITLVSDDPHFKVIEGLKTGWPLS